jgi:hypothetical protein
MDDVDGSDGSVWVVRPVYGSEGTRCRVGRVLAAHHARPATAHQASHQGDADCGDDYLDQ